MENPVPAVTWAGARKSAATATIVSTIDRQSPKIRSLLRILDVVVLVEIHHNVIILHLAGNVIGDIYREADGYLRKQFLVNVAVGNPDHFTAGVVIRRDHMRDVDNLAALISELPT